MYDTARTVSHTAINVESQMHRNTRKLKSTSANDALIVERQRAQITLDSIGDGVISTDMQGKVTYLNVVAERMTGWSREEVFGRMFSEVFRIIDGDNREPTDDTMKLAIQQNDTVCLPRNSLLIQRAGSELAIEDSTAPIHDQNGQVTGAVMVFRDVSEARAAELKLSHLAHHDILTDLPNRTLLIDRLNHAIALAQRHGNQVGVLFLDLDRFKPINDSLGHAIGDKLLQEVSRRLVASVRRSDTVSRHGGDEFVVLLSEVRHTKNAARHAEKIHAALSAPYAIAHRDLRVTVSIGISMSPNDGEDAETLIKCADAAMYCAKETGRNAYRFFEPYTYMNLQAVEWQSLAAA
jgi:diguanylate cyclase (GGDEF)-like protein/PAS domain S-box-containing protein